MAWIYLAESEGCQSHCKNGLDPLHPVKLTPIVKESCCPELRLVNLRRRPYGMILKHWMGLDSQGDMSISYLEDSRVRILALQAVEKAWMESEVAFFLRSSAWPKKSSPASYFLKTCPPSQAEGDFKSLEKLPNAGMIVDGILYPLSPLEPDIKDGDGSYWPTPTAVQIDEDYATYQLRMKNSNNPKNIGKKKPQNLQMAVRMWPTPDSSARGAYKSQEKRIGHHFTIQDAVGSGKLNPMWIEWLMGYSKEWTELEPWAMQWFQNKRRKHSKY